MGKQNFILCLIFSYFFFSTANAKLPNVLFGIKLQNLDSEYIRLLFDSGLDNASQRQLSAALSAVQFCLHIDRELAPMDLHTSKLKHVKLKQKNVPEIVDLRMIFEDLRKSIEQKQPTNLDDSDLCKLWDFEELLLEITRELVVQLGDGKLKMLDKTRMELEKKHKCADLHGQTLPAWATLFKYKRSLKHFNYFESKLALDVSQKEKPTEWFGSKPLENESELSHRLRLLNQSGDFDQVKGIKTLMEQWLVARQELGHLVSHHPMTMSAEAMRDFEFITLIDDMFDNNVNISLGSEGWIEFFFVYAKILAYFKQFYADGKKLLKNNKMDDDHWWRSFVNVLEKLKIDRMVISQQQLTGEIYPIFGELERAFSNQKMEQKFQLMFHEYGQKLLQFYHGNEMFRKKFNTQKIRREKLKHFFQLIDRPNQIMPKKLWQLFDVASSSSFNAAETVAYENNINEISYNKKPYLECPNLTEINNSKNTLLEQYEDNLLWMEYVKMLLRWAATENGGFIRGGGTQCDWEAEEATLAMDAALWAYRELIGVHLLGFAIDAVVPTATDPTFNALINERYKPEWDKVKKNTTKNVPNGGDANSKLCTLHKFALALVRDEQLHKNAQWNSQLQSLVSQSDIFRIDEPKLILLSDEADISSWANVDCMNSQMAANFVQHIKTVPEWVGRMHFYAISTLITKSVSFQSIFCYGAANVNASAFSMKFRLRLLLQPNVFNAIESAFPEILHFEMQLETTYLDLLLNKLEHKSGTVWAEGYEARLSLPAIMQNIKQFEDFSVPTAGNALNQTIRQIAHEKIGAIKERAYASIGEENPTEWCKSLCLVVELNTFLAELYANLNNGIIRDMFSWEPACQSEEAFKKALYDQRKQFKENHLMAINRLLQTHYGQIKSRPGVSTKLWKMLNDWEGNKTLVDAYVTDAVVWETDEMRRRRRKELFSDNNLLLSHYEQILFVNLNPFDQMAQLLLADVIIFVRWAEEKLRLARRSIETKRIENSWENCKEILDAIYDRVWDEQEQTLGQLGNGVTKFLNELKQYLERGELLGLKQNHCWTNMKWAHIDSVDNNGGSLPMDPAKRAQTQYEQWKQSMHREAIAALIREMPAFADRLKKANNLSLELTVVRLAFIVGGENAKAILAKLNEDESSSLPKIASSSEAQKMVKIENKLGNNANCWTKGFSGSNSPTTPHKVLVATNYSPTSSSAASSSSSPAATKMKTKQLKNDSTIKEKAKGKCDKKTKTIINNNDNNISNKNNSDKKSPPKNGPKRTNIEVSTDKGGKNVKNGNKNKKGNTEDKNNDNNNSEKEETTEETEGQSSITDELFDAIVVHNKDYSGITLGNFEQDGFLATKFEQFINLMKRTNGQDPNSPETLTVIDSLVQLLNFGIYANEIAHRFQLIKHLGQVLHRHIEIEATETEWAQLKVVELSRVKNAVQLIDQLFWMLKQIVAKMDNFECEKAQNVDELEKSIVANQLKVRKLAKFIVENEFRWGLISTKGQIEIFNKLLGQTNAATMDEQKMVVADFETLLKKVKRLDAQRKSDKDMFDQHKEDPFLAQQQPQEQNGKRKLEEKPKIKMDLYEIADGWQEIDFNEKMISKNLAQQSVSIVTNGQMENGDKRREKMNTIIEMKKIFDSWSEKARFQVPAFFHLKPCDNNEPLKTICMLPDGFDVVGNLFGEVECNLSKRMLCKDNSLFCKLCKNPLVHFLLKNSMGRKRVAVPKLEITFMGTKFVVHFVVVSELEHIPIQNFNFKDIPTQNFDGSQLQIFLNHFASLIHTLLYDSYVDEGNYENDGAKRVELIMLLEEELFMTEDDDKMSRILDKIDQLNSKSEKVLTMPTKKDEELDVLSKAKMVRQRIDELREPMNVLWNHALPQSVLELLLTRAESFGLNHRMDQAVMNGTTLIKFRAIYAFVESWAKEKNLFNEHYGHFNSHVIMIMTAKVLLLFPEGGTSVPFLLEKFFLIYSLWDWPMPLHLRKVNEKKRGEFLNWSPTREWFEQQQQKNELGQQIWTEMPIISPMFPHQNVANRIDLSTTKNIQKELLNGFKLLTKPKTTSTTIGGATLLSTE